MAKLLAHNITNLCVTRLCLQSNTQISLNKTRIKFHKLSVFIFTYKWAKRYWIAYLYNQYKGKTVHLILSWIWRFVVNPALDIKIVLLYLLRFCGYPIITTLESTLFKKIVFRLASHRQLRSSSDCLAIIGGCIPQSSSAGTDGLTRVEPSTFR